MKDELSLSSRAGRWPARPRSAWGLVGLAGILGLSCLWATLALAQANGKLQIHFMDVGQADGALLISPKGQTVLFDDGAERNCEQPVSYLQQLGVTTIDYHIASHYHADHIGCAREVFQEFPLQREAYGRGGDYRASTYDRYAASVGTHRKTVTDRTEIVLDQG